MMFWTGVGRTGRDASPAHKEDTREGLCEMPGTQPSEAHGVPVHEVNLPINLKRINMSSI